MAVAYTGPVYAAPESTHIQRKKLKPHVGGAGRNEVANGLNDIDPVSLASVVDKRTVLEIAQASVNHRADAPAIELDGLRNTIE